MKGVDMTNESDRKFVFIDPEDIDTSEMEDIDGSCVDVLKDALLDIIQLAEAQGMTEDEADESVRRVFEFRAQRNRNRFTLHTSEPS